MSQIDLIAKELAEAADTLQKFLSEEQNLASINDAAESIAACLLKGGKVISCGNGGSMCDAMHFAEELTGRYRESRHAMAAIAIADPSHITCVANDFGFDFIFSKFIEGVGHRDDVLLAISTSGNSRNILKAAEAARQKGMLVVALTGKDGGALADIADIEIRVSHLGYADRIQEVHIKIIHILIYLIEKLT